MRFILGFTGAPATAATLIEFGVWAFEALREAVPQGAFPEIGVDEAGMYFAEDGICWTPGTGQEPIVKNYDIRTSRALRGSDRTLALAVRNQASTGNLNFTANFRMLVAYG